jgi:hypothetical protein
MHFFSCVAYHDFVTGNIPKSTWLNGRKVVFSKRGAMLCKSAKISVMGFPGSVFG